MNPDRYYIDERCGCIAVRDRTLDQPMERYPGLHDYTPGVVEYWHGKWVGSWVIPDAFLAKAKAECERLNAETPLPAVHPNDRPIVHVCKGGKLAPYPRLLCSTCRDPSEGIDLSTNDVVRMFNDAGAEPKLVPPVTPMDGWREGLMLIEATSAIRDAVNASGPEEHIYVKLPVSHWRVVLAVLEGQRAED